MPAKPLDEKELNDRLAAALPDREVAPVTPLTGGTSSLTYWTTLDGDEKVVVKVCPPGLDPVRNRDVLRQARIQNALEGTAVPAPRVLVEDPGEPPDVPPYYVMAFTPGECVEVGSMAPEDLPPPGDVRGRFLDVARLMGELHSIEPAGIGLGDEGETTLVEEVNRWKAALDACDDDLKADTDDVYEWLMANVPDAVPTVLLHGDFRTGNTLAEGDHVNAVIDWEIWSRGDPRVDLAWFLIFVENASRPNPPGTPSVDELFSTYGKAWGGEIRDLDWFRVLVRYKQVAAGNFIQRNARRRGAPVEPVDNNQNWLMISARELMG